MQGLSDGGQDALKKLTATLDQAVERGTILRTTVAAGTEPVAIFFLNTELDRQEMVKVQSGEIVIPGLKAAPSVAKPASEPVPDVFTLYEENVGLLTPMVAEEMRDALKSYPEAWIRDAIREAANNNKRKWSYVSAILERWSSEGKSDGTNRGYPKKADPDKYIKGKYGHMVQR
jgi:DNA replication protein